jgi:hypothetical protein
MIAKAQSALSPASQPKSPLCPLFLCVAKVFVATRCALHERWINLRLGCVRYRAEPGDQILRDLFAVGLIEELMAGFRIKLVLHSLQSRLAVLGQ